MYDFRCSDIGKYAMTGSQTRKCIGGAWDGAQPACIGLNQATDYASEYLFFCSVLQIGIN